MSEISKEPIDDAFEHSADDPETPAYVEMPSGVSAAYRSGNTLSSEDPGDTEFGDLAAVDDARSAVASALDEGGADLLPDDVEARPTIRVSDRRRILPEGTPKRADAHGHGSTWTGYVSGEGHYRSGGVELAWRTQEQGVDRRQFLQTHGDEAQGDLLRMKSEPLIVQDSRFTSYAPSPKAPAPRSSLLLKPGESERPYTHMDDERVAFVGAGAGAVFSAAYLAHRGMPSENMTFIDPSGEIGGQWRDADVRTGGVNNPANMQVLPGHTLDITNRSGDGMLALQDSLADAYLADAQLLPDRVTELRRNAKTGEWLVGTGEGEQVQADYVVVATGTPHPRPIDSDRIRSNLEKMAGRTDPDDLILDRSQQVVTSEMAASGRTAVMMGIGNSWLTMERQYQQWEDAFGVTIPRLTLTDLPKRALLYNDQSIDGRRPVARNPKKGYLTGLSIDLPADRQVFDRAMRGHQLVTDVRRVDYSPRDHSLHVTTLRGKLPPIETPRVFALFGFERDNRLLQQLGAQTVRSANRQFIPDIRARDGAVRTARDDYRSNVFVAGAAAAVPGDANAAVGPGILSRVPHTSLTMAVRAYAAQHAPAPSIFRRIFTR